MGIAKVGTVKREHDLGSLLDRADAAPRFAAVRWSSAQVNRGAQEPSLGDAHAHRGRLGIDASVADNEPGGQQRAGAAGSAGFLIGDKVEYDVATRLDAVATKRGQPLDRGSDATLHVGAAPAVEST